MRIKFEGPVQHNRKSGKLIEQRDYDYDAQRTRNYESSPCEVQTGKMYCVDATCEKNEQKFKHLQLDISYEW